LLLSLVFAQAVSYVALVPDQSGVEELAAATTDPRARCPDRAAQGSDPASGEHCVECGGEFRVAISEQKLDGGQDRFDLGA